MSLGIPDYKNLDLSGEAGQAARNMEDRAQEPASQELFDRLVAPLIPSDTCQVLEVGCGSGALAARIAQHNPQAQVLATDKSQGMLDAAQVLHKEPNLRFRIWDVTVPSTKPEHDGFDLIVSSVMLPYLSGDETIHAVHRLARMLNSGGTLAFVEQDIQSLSATSNQPEFMAKYVRRISTTSNPNGGLALLPIFEQTGLTPLRVETFKWTDPDYCPYVRRLQARTAKDMSAAGESTPEEAQAWLDSMEALAAEGKFLYSLDYRLFAATK